MWKNVGNENLKKTTLPLIVVDQRLQENLEYFNSLGSMMINDARFIYYYAPKVAGSNPAEAVGFLRT
jgi:hypothetical protein